MLDPRQVSLSLPSLDSLFCGLPEEWQTKALRDKLTDAYRNAVTALVLAALQLECPLPYVMMLPWRQVGSQYLCEYWVTASPVQAPTDCQWSFAGVIVCWEGNLRVHHTPVDDHDAPG